ncbi:MAG: nitroreductase [Hyphomonadaceae bacterium]
METLALLAQRRSVKIMHLSEPGPTGAQLEALLRQAARTPDHVKLAPWRIIVIEGAGRQRAGRALGDIMAGEPGATAERVAFEQERFMGVPACVIVVSKAATHAKIPEWEQELSAGAVCYGLLIAAPAMGFAGCWLTDWFAYNARARAALGLSAQERIAGAIYLGTAREPATERARPALSALITRF